jgi:hypothetical protein
MRVYARNRQDVADALTNNREYRDLAESLGAILPSKPLARLTEARHAIQSASLPQPGEMVYQTPVRRQRELIRAMDQLQKVSIALSAENPAAYEDAIRKDGTTPQPNWTAAASIDAKVKRIAESHTAARGENEAFVGQRFVDHAREALKAINAVETAFNRHGNGVETQVLALEASGKLRAIAYAHEASNPGSSLASRHKEEEFVGLRAQAARNKAAEANGPRPGQTP